MADGGFSPTIEQKRNAFSAQEGPQDTFLRLDVDIAIYGGAAGSGKSYALLLEPMHYATRCPGYSAVIFRRNTTNIRNPGALWDQSMALYSLHPHSKPSESIIEWSFKGISDERKLDSNGDPTKHPEWIGKQVDNRVKFAHLEYEKTVYDWHGAQVPLIAFDELTEFSQKQFFYMLSRNRSTCGIRPYIRATCNPDADSWVAEFIAWYIDQSTGFPIPERSGVIRWFMRVGDDLVWADHEYELMPELLGLPTHTPEGQLIEYEAKSFTFISATIYDNKILMEKDPSYLANLLAQPTVERERLFAGNWKIKPAAGLHFQRQWVEVIDVLPAGLTFKRGWDLAATEKTQNNDPDFTCSTKIGKALDGSFVVADHTYGQMSSARVETLMKNTASQDGPSCEQNLPQDPGQAGKSQVLNFAKFLGAYPVRSSPETGDKVTRFGPFSAHAEIGNVKVLRGDWNERWFGQLEGFPDLTHDDDADSTSRAFNAFLDSKDGLLEFYQKEANKLAAAKLGRDAPPPSSTKDGGVLIKPPNPAINTLYDMKGRPLHLRADGCFLVTPEHAQLLRRSGFVEVTGGD